MSRTKFSNNLPFKKRRELYKSHKMQHKASSTDMDTVGMEDIYQTVDSRRPKFENLFSKNNSTEKLSPFKVLLKQASTANTLSDLKSQNRASLPVSFGLKNDNIVDLVKNASDLLVKMKEECLLHKERINDAVPQRFAYKRKTRSAFSNKNSSEILNIISNHSIK